MSWRLWNCNVLVFSYTGQILVNPLRPLLFAEPSLFQFLPYFPSSGHLLLLFFAHPFGFKPKTTDLTGQRSTVELEVIMAPPAGFELLFVDRQSTVLPMDECSEDLFGGPARIRTEDLPITSRLLYPSAELRSRKVLFDAADDTL